MECPKCGDDASCKDGKVQGRQRYLCRPCSYRYTVVQRSGTADKAAKRQALVLYLEGFGIRAIARMLGFSNVAVLNWIKAFGGQVQALRNQALAKVVGLDELQGYIGAAKNDATRGLLLVDMQEGFSVVQWVSGRPSREQVGWAMQAGVT